MLFQETLLSPLPLCYKGCLRQVLIFCDKQLRRGGRGRGEFSPLMMFAAMFCRLQTHFRWKNYASGFRWRRKSLLTLSEGCHMSHVYDIFLLGISIPRVLRRFRAYNYRWRGLCGWHESMEETVVSTRCYTIPYFYWSLFLNQSWNPSMPIVIKVIVSVGHDIQKGVQKYR